MDNNSTCTFIEADNYDCKDMIPHMTWLLHAQLNYTLATRLS